MLLTNLRPTILAAAILILGPCAGVLAQGTTAGAPGDRANGRAVYTEIGCGACHGEAGRGTAAAPSIATGAIALADFSAYTRSPSGGMPPYGTDVLSDQSLADLYAYLQPAVARPAPAGRADVGASLYRASGCYSCHSNEAQGGMHGPRLGPDPVTFVRFTWYTRHPTRSMPPYTAAVLSDQDLADIYAFVEQQPQPPAVSTIPLLAP